MFELYTAHCTKICLIDCITDRLIFLHQITLHAGLTSFIFWGFSPSFTMKEVSILIQASTFKELVIFNS